MTEPTSILPCGSAATWGPAIDEAVHALSRGALVVVPTDTVYGLAADAFNPAAVAALLSAKGRGRQMPPSVLVPDARTSSDTLVAGFWPGGLTIICRAHSSLAWDLGDTGGTVAIRMPDHPAALALLARTGPLAVSSANVTGQPAALSAEAAFAQLGGSVAVYLDSGRAPGGVASTIVDATGDALRLVRSGAISLEQLQSVVSIDDPGEASAS